MKTDYIYQLFSIVLYSGALLYFWDRLCHMKYSFWRIILRAMFYHDFEPMDWLVSHLYNVGFLLLVIGHFFAIQGLIQQIGTPEFHTKPMAFFISPWFNQIGLVASVAFILKKERVKIKRIFIRHSH